MSELKDVGERGFVLAVARKACEMQGLAGENYEHLPLAQREAFERGVAYTLGALDLLGYVIARRIG